MNCLVTGVSRGIGRALAAELLREGHTVWGLSRTPASVPAVDGPGRFRHVCCDVCNPESRNSALEAMDAEGFVPDVVVLNAAIEYEEEKTSMSWDKMQAVLDTNVAGALFWVAHWMNRRPLHPMQFIGISTLLALWPDVDCPAYSMSKAALSMAFRSFRLRFPRDPVDFKLVYLGPVQTSINPRFTEGGPAPRGVETPEAVARYIAKTVLSSRRFSFYYPLTTRLVCRLGAWMPDLLFERLTRPLRR